MTAVKNSAAALLALAGMTSQLAAAPSCATADDMAAFRTAAVQQQLMVAALTCHDIDAYNRFVIAYRPELQKSDADLKTYFIHQGSEAAYDTFKTKLANLSSLSDIANGPAYCANAGAAFDIALRSRQSLASFVADQRLMIAMPRQTLCEARPVEASAALPVKVAAAPARPPVRLAAADPASVVEGVPSHDLPASPYGDARDEQPQPASYNRAGDAYADNDNDADEDDAPPPPPPRRPRAMQAQPDDDYYAPDYAYPPRWWPRGRRWYPLAEDER